METKRRLSYFTILLMFSLLQITVCELDDEECRRCGTYVTNPSMTTERSSCCRQNWESLARESLSIDFKNLDDNVREHLQEALDHINTVRKYAKCEIGLLRGKRRQLMTRF